MHNIGLDPGLYNNEPEGIKLILIWIWQFIKDVKSGDIWIKL